MEAKKPDPNSAGSKAKLAETQGAKDKPYGPKPSPKGGGKGDASLSTVKRNFSIQLF